MMRSHIKNVLFGAWCLATGMYACGTQPESPPDGRAEPSDSIASSPPNTDTTGPSAPSDVTLAADTGEPGDIRRLLGDTPLPSDLEPPPPDQLSAKDLIATESSDANAPHWPTGECASSVVGTGSKEGEIAHDFQQMDQFGGLLRLHDYCDRLVLLVGAAYW